ncbi:MAG: hypothetical protein IJI50_04905 [Ruminococcus sp.]|nr:hypothetical protein [Ruminococcus sp.]
MISNSTIRAYAKEQGVFLWEIANAMNVSEPTITRWLRVSLDPEREKSLYNAIDRVAAQHAEQSTATAQ